MEGGNWLVSDSSESDNKWELTPGFWGKSERVLCIFSFFFIIIKYFQDALWQLKVGDTASTSKQAAVTLCAVGHVPLENKQFSQL